MPRYSVGSSEYGRTHIDARDRNEAIAVGKAVLRLPTWARVSAYPSPGGLRRPTIGQFRPVFSGHAAIVPDRIVEVE